MPPREAGVIRDDRQSVSEHLTDHRPVFPAAEELRFECGFDFPDPPVGREYGNRIQSQTLCVFVSQGFFVEPFVTVGITDGRFQIAGKLLNADFSSDQEAFFPVDQQIAVFVCRQFRVSGE